MWEKLCRHLSLFHDEHIEAEVPGTLQPAMASWLLGLFDYAVRREGQDVGRNLDVFSTSK